MSATTIIYNPKTCPVHLRLFGGGVPTKGQKYAVHTRYAPRYSSKSKQPATWLVPIIRGVNQQVARMTQANLLRADRKSRTKGLLEALRGLRRL